MPRRAPPRRARQPSCESGDEDGGSARGGSSDGDDGAGEGEGEGVGAGGGEAQDEARRPPRKKARTASPGPAKPAVLLDGREIWPKPRGEATGAPRRRAISDAAGSSRALVPADARVPSSITLQAPASTAGGTMRTRRRSCRMSGDWLASHQSSGAWR